MIHSEKIEFFFIFLNNAYRISRGSSVEVYLATGFVEAPQRYLGLASRLYDLKASVWH